MASKAPVPRFLPPFAARSRQAPTTRDPRGTFGPGRARSGAGRANDTRWAPLRQRLLKYLKRFLILLVILAVIGVAAFTWLFYWPLEGSVDDVLTLVPEDVEFVLRADHDDLRATDWVQENVIRDPLTEALGQQVADVLERIDLELETIQSQVDAQSPIAVDVPEFVDENVLAGEVCIAGNFWEHSSIGRGEPPQWKHLLVLKRVSRISRCISGLRHGFIRRQVQLGPGMELSAESDDVFKITLLEVRGNQAARRPGAPDMSQWYLARVKDVVAVTNHRELLDEVLRLGEDPQARSFATRPGFDIPQTPGRVTAAVNIAPLHDYLSRIFDYHPDLRALRSFLPPEALTKLSGRLSLESTGMLAGGGQVTFVESTSEAEDVNRSIYSLPPREVSDGIASLVPAEDTYAVLSLRTNPEYLLGNIVWNAVPADIRKLWTDNLRANPEAGFSTVPEFFEDLSTRMGNEAMVAVARMGDIYDDVDFLEWWSPEPEPIPALAIMVRLGEGATQAELEEYLSSKVFLLGMEKALDRVQYGNFTYSKAKLKIETLDYKYVNPCFLVVQDYLVMTSSEGYMRRILDTVRDGEAKALAQDDTFRSTMGTLPQTGHVGIFVDLEKLYRVPSSIRLDPEDPEGSDLGAPGTRGFLWDKRNSWVIKNKDDRTEAIRWRAQERRKFPERMNSQQQAELDRRERAYMQSWEARYPEFIEEYRRELAGMRRFRGAGLVLGANQGDLDARFVLLLQPGDGGR